VAETNQKIKTVGILQPGYLPWLGFFEQLYRSDIFVIYDDVQFEKGSWRNRNRIKTPQGIQWLTVPVLKGRQGFQIIKDVRINNSVPWQKKHIKSIRQNYSKAVHFDYYTDELFGIIGKHFDFLLNLNIELIDWFCKMLGIQTKTILSSELYMQGNGIERLIRIIKHLGGDTFYEGSAGRNYIDVNTFENSDIKVQFQDYKHPVYYQLYGDFIPYLSIIDLLFNHGPETLNIILRRGF